MAYPKIVGPSLLVLALLFVGILGISTAHADISSGLVGYWALDDGSGTTLTDSSGNGESGSTFGNTSWTTGKIGGALSFDGSTGSANVNDAAPLQLSSAGTISVWVKQGGSNSWQSLVNKFNMTGDRNGYGLYINRDVDGYTATLELANGSAYNSAVSGSGIPLNTWTHIVGTWNGSVMTLYVNGAQSGSPASETVMPSSTGYNVHLGISNTGFAYLNGALDDVRIYNRALSAADVSQLYAYAGSGSSGSTGGSSGPTAPPAGPVISAVASSNVASSSASIAWTTDQAADSQVEYGPTTAYGAMTALDPSFVASHAVSLSSLSASTAYHFRVRSKNASGVLTVSSDYGFTTAAGSIGSGSTGSGQAPATCSQTDVQNALNAAPIGGTVVIPAGTCTWGDNATSVSINKAVTLQGSGRGATVINISPTAGAWGAGIIGINAPATIKSLTIKTPTAGNSGTAFSAAASGFRITDVEYINQSPTIDGYFLYTEYYGLVDSNSITAAPGGTDELIFVRGPLNSWQTPDSLGGPDNVFIEDNTFNGPGYVTDCNSNSRCVVRFNTITGTMKIDGHGKYSNTPPRGVREMEAYDNTWTIPGGTYFATMEFRGGTGRAFDNTSPGGSGWLLMQDYYVLNNVYTAANYPIDDQIGVGEDPKAAASDPFYLWGNRAGGSNWLPTSYASMAGVINPDRDYYNEATAFDGSSGVGVGTLAQMSAITPTKVGVGFWVTDEGNWNTNTSATDGVLYVWNGTQWKLDYIPYSYPDPRRGAPYVPPPAFPPVTPGSGGGVVTSTTTVATTTPTTPTVPVTPPASGGGSHSGGDGGHGSGGGSSGGSGGSKPKTAATMTTMVGSTTACANSAASPIPVPYSFTIGTRSAGVMALQTFLYNQGYLAKQRYITGYYGSLTNSALGSYLANVATASCATKTAATAAFTQNLSFGSTGTQVAAVQNLLQTQGFFAASATGYYGPVTEAAVGRFQTHYGIVSAGQPGYGMVGPKTRSELNGLAVQGSL